MTECDRGSFTHQAFSQVLTLTRMYFRQVMENEAKHDVPNEHAFIKICVLLSVSTEDKLLA